MQTAHWSPFHTLGFPEHGGENYLEDSRRDGLWQRITDHARYTPEYLGKLLRADADRRLMLDHRYRIRSVEGDVRANLW